MNLHQSTNTSETFNEPCPNLSDLEDENSPDAIDPEKLVQIISADSNFISQYPNVKILEPNPQVHRLQTIIRDVKSSRSDFCFAADRLVRLVIEAGLDELPIRHEKVITPGEHEYNGSQWTKQSCGVSIIRSGEAMEIGLRECCRSIRIGKILIQTDDETGKSTVYYSKFPPYVNKRIILLMYPILNYDSSVSEAIKVLEKAGCESRQIILLTLFCTPNGIQALSQKYGNMTIFTTEISSNIG